MSINMSALRQIQNNAGYTLCAYQAAKKTFYFSHARGIAPILQALAKADDYFQDAIVCDVVIGKAAAMLLVRSHVKAIYASVMSEAAKEILEQFHVSYRYDTLCPYIINRTNDGMCPMEQCVIAITDLEEAYLALKQTAQRLQATSS